MAGIGALNKNRLPLVWCVIPLASLALLCSCSEARSDIENIDAKELESEADALLETASNSTDEQVTKIQTFNVQPQPVDAPDGENIVQEQ